MRVAIHCFPDQEWSAWLWRVERLLQANNIPVARVCSSAPCFWDEIRQFTHYIHIWGQWDRSEQEACTILPVIEQDFGLNCFPDSKTRRLFDNKAQQSLFLKAHHLPTPEAWLFWDKGYALDWAATAPLPLVFKLRGGAGSANVRLITTRKQLTRVICRMFTRGYHPAHDLQHQGLAMRTVADTRRLLANNKRRLRNQAISHDIAVPNWKTHKHYVYFQEYIPNNTYDTRIVTIGDKCYGHIRHNRRNDFRASGHTDTDRRPEMVDTRCVRRALEISQTFGFQSMAYDFLLDTNHEPTIVEMSYIFADWGVHRCPGHWNDALEWHAGPCWPQQLLLESFLGVATLQPPPDIDRFDGYLYFSMKDHQS